MISYKCEFYGKTFHRVDRWFASSKTCSCCGFKLEKLDLGTREWQCPSCGNKHDRDLNAAMNIKNKGQLDCYDKIMSDAIADLVEIPMALMKRTDKIERSLASAKVGSGMEQAARSLVVQ